MSKRKERRSSKAPVAEFTGKVQMTREGNAYIVLDAGDEANGSFNEDIFVRAAKMRGALNGDTVKVIVRKSHDKDKSRRGRARKPQRVEGEVTEIVERSRRPFIGVLQIAGGKAWVLMESRVMPYDISVSLDNVRKSGARQGEKVAVRIVRWDRRDPEPVGEIVDVLGLPGENDTEMHAILAEYELPYRFTKEVEAAADEIPDDLNEKEFSKRRDFRDTLTFTIDPSDAKDFDDALSVCKKGKLWEIGVHIADVTHYVRRGSIVDKEALKRGTSVYLVDRTVPMLPEMLSNKLCSLRPGEEKLCFSVVFTVSESGEIKSRWIGRTVIKSDYRFDYDAAQNVIEGKIPQVPSEYDLRESDPLYGELKEAILASWSIAGKLREARFRAGAISFERPEMKVIVDEKGRPVDVRQKISKEANWLIEEFMLLANRSVAEAVAKIKKTFVYRVHEEPVKEKLDSLRTFVKNFGYKLGPTENGKEIARSLNKLFKASSGKPESDVIELLALRCMARAHYTTDNCGHYGLAFDYYTHFTSPIRRYPDMMVHRLLEKYMDGGRSQNKKHYEELCEYCSQREQVATDAERASIKYKLVEFMKDKEGFEYDGFISGLTDWGMYVEIEPTKIEGMVALRDIAGDYYEFDEKNYRIVGKSTRRTFTLGDKVRIRVRRASLEQKLLDFDLISLEGQKPAADRSAVSKKPSSGSGAKRKKQRNR